MNNKITNHKSQITKFSILKHWNLRFGTRELHQGFTLIELLIVIVIIGILSTFVISNFVGIRERARDAQRKTDLRQIQTALQLYYSDEGVYPQDDELDECGIPLTSSVNSDSNITYMKEIPCDPLQDASDTENTYLYRAQSPLGAGSVCTNTSDALNPCVGYLLTACLENERDPETDDDNNDEYCDIEEGLRSFTVSNP